MYQGCYAKLEMERPLLLQEEKNTAVLNCEVLKYDEWEECIYLIVQQDLEELSLDAIYACRVCLKQEQLVCRGRIQERYKNEHGNIAVLQIENGFYKINIKCVDKQEAE